jgi:hypothetical protein
MSKHQTIKVIRLEIDRLNREIDLRIIRGISYRREALRHKHLSEELARLLPRRSNWLARSLDFVSIFLF